MRGFIFVFSAVLYGLLIQGCMSSSVIVPDINKNIQKWIDDKDYGKALSILNVLDEGAPGYEKVRLKKKEILKLVIEYEDEVLGYVSNDIKLNDLAKAIERFDVALKHVPDSKALNDALSMLLTQENVRISKSDLSVLVAKSELLEKSLVYYKLLEQVGQGDLYVQEDLRKSEAEAEMLAEELMKYANFFLSENNLVKADSIIMLASKLDDSEEVEKVRGEIKRVFEERKDKLKKKKLLRKIYINTELEKETAGLIKRFDSAFSHDDFVGARVFLVKLMSINATHKEVLGRRDRFRRGVSAYIEKEIKVGYSHYKRDQYDLALDRWNNILKLNPVHKQANEYVVRVKKVLKKLDDLESKRLTKAQRNVAG